MDGTTSVNTIDELANRYVDRSAALDPCLATFVGIAGHDGQMTDYSPDGLAGRAELARSTLAEIARAPISDDHDRIAVAAMSERIGLELELHDAGLLASDLNTIASPLQMIRQTFDLTGTDDGWAAVAERLGGVPDALAGYRHSLTESATRGLVSARRQVTRCAQQCEQWAGHGGQPGTGFFTGLVAGYGDGPRRAELDRLAARASEATAEFGRFLCEELAPLAPERDAVGADRYALWSRYFTGARLDLAETYAWGWQELARIRTQMYQVAGELVRGVDAAGEPDEVIARAIAALEADPARRIVGPENFRAWMQELSDRTVDALAGVHFDIAEPIRTLECRIAPTHDGGCYYTGPSEDFGRPGRMWWALPEGVDSFGTWRETTTVFHEGVPGHHLQVAQTAYRSELLNRYQRLLLWVSGHGEGWALYAERLMADLGHLDDPGDRMGMLDAQAFRAARVVLDIGMHLELTIPAGAGFHDGQRWTPELGLEFLRANCSLADANVRDEIDRYLGWPGQAPAYKVGERVWLAAREDARSRHGAAFDLRAFHTAALNLGSMGLDPLRDELARF